MIVLVLRSGGIYTADDAVRLADQLGDSRVVVLSDVDVPLPRIPLAHGWPGWWAKMELFRPDLGLDDFLYLDLDTMVRGDLFHMEQCGRLALLRDFYRQWGLGSGMMFLPADVRNDIWLAWTANPSRWMAQFQLGGDQEFLEQHWVHKAARLQDLYPGEIASYKASSPDEVRSAKVVCFHGEPKPRDINWTL